MQYGICSLSIVPVRLVADDASEMVSQLLYGEHFKVLEKRKYWSRIRNAFDGFEGWVNNLQITVIAENQYEEIENSKKHEFSADLISFVSNDSNVLLPIVVGSSVQNTGLLSHSFDGESIHKRQQKSALVRTALQYLNAPDLSGGRTPFGIDNSGFTQMVYKINGHAIKRSSLEQSAQGEVLSFIEESEPGDLAFFDNKDGIIEHVGIIMKDNYIIHVYGKVRIDRIDHTGIFNAKTRNYTHSLRVIKKLI